LDIEDRKLDVGLLNAKPKRMPQKNTLLSGFLRENHLKLKRDEAIVNGFSVELFFDKKR